MTNEKILEEILENTKTVKTVIVDKVEAEEKKKAEKKEKAKSAQQRAESKFKNVGAKFNEQEQDEIKNRLTDLDINQSQYIKKLIQDDLSTKKSLNEDLSSTNESNASNANYEALEATSKRVKELESELYICETKYVTEIEKVKRLEKGINEFNELSLFQKIKWVVKGEEV